MKQNDSSSIVALDAAFSEKMGIRLPIDLLNKKYTLNEFSDMSIAWYNHVKDTCDELKNLRVPDNDQWMVKVEDAGIASNLICDLIEMTRWIPYKGNEIDMRVIAYNYLIVCPDNHKLAKFFK